MEIVGVRIDNTSFIIRGGGDFFNIPTKRHDNVHHGEATARFWFGTILFSKRDGHQGYGVDQRKVERLSRSNGWER